MLEIETTLPVMDSISGSESLSLIGGDTAETSELGSDECIEFWDSGNEWSLNLNLRGADEDSIENKRDIENGV